MQFYNTKTRQKEALKPLSSNEISMYVCGPTVYATPHLGNARSVVIYDLLFRVLQTKYNVNYVRNITDVDDKINAAAKENGEKISDLTTRVTKDFHDICETLGCLAPTHEPRATDNIAEIIIVIENLIKNNHAYEAEGHVLFDVNSDENYGHLSGRSLDEMESGVRIEVASYKRNPHDFVLWKPADKADDESAKFASPWGVGRPGWHIECTAMSTKFLGENFDIHGGGADLKFPHHENEIAQSCCANKGSTYATSWIHNGFLMVGGEKMSKSLGNFTTVRDLLEQDINGDIIRMALLSTHYRSPLDWNEKLVQDSKKTMDSFYRLFDTKAEAQADEKLLEFLADDMNISKSFAYLNELASDANKGDENAKSKLLSNLKFLGFLNYSADEYFGRSGSNDDAEIEALIEARKQARADKDFAEADRIRGVLDDMKIIIDDKRDGTVEWRRG